MIQMKSWIDFILEMHTLSKSYKSDSKHNNAVLSTEIYKSVEPQKLKGYQRTSSPTLCTQQRTNLDICLMDSAVFLFVFKQKF